MNCTAHSKIWTVGIILILFLMSLTHTVFATGDDLSDLKRLLNSFDDSEITVQDLAFCLITHDYDAKPMKDYVELNLNGKIFKLVPNGSEPGLCSISAENITKWDADQTASVWSPIQEVQAFI